MITPAGIDTADELAEPAELFDYFDIRLVSKPNPPSRFCRSDGRVRSISPTQQTLSIRASFSSCQAVSSAVEQLALPFSNNHVGEILLFTPRYKELIDLYTIDELTPVIGFKCGALALHNAGFERLGDILRSKPSILASIPNVGEKKISQIVEYFRQRGVAFADPPIPKRGQRLVLCRT